MNRDEPILPSAATTATVEQRERLLRRRPVASDGPAIEIGPPAESGRFLRRAGRIFGGVAIFLLAGWACSVFAGSFRVALIVVGLMAAYMLVVGRITEGRADRVDG